MLYSGLRMSTRCEFFERPEEPPSHWKAFWRECRPHNSIVLVAERYDHPALTGGQNISSGDPPLSRPMFHSSPFRPDLPTLSHEKLGRRDCVRLSLPWPAQKSIQNGCLEPKSDFQPVSLCRMAGGRQQLTAKGSVLLRWLHFLERSILDEDGHAME